MRPPYTRIGISRQCTKFNFSHHNVIIVHPLPLWERVAPRQVRRRVRGQALSAG
jgi:hypothetical protein